MRAYFHRSERERQTEREREREREREMRVHATREYFSQGFPDLVWEYFSQGFPDLVFPDATLSPSLSLSMHTSHPHHRSERERGREIDR